MRTVHLNAHASHLQQSASQLRTLWQTLEADWNDQVRRDFHDRRLAPFEQRIESTAFALNTLNESIQRLMRAVAPEDSDAIV